MKAKKINEAAEFKRGLEPTKALGLGYSNYNRYIKARLKKQKLSIRSFWDYWWQEFLYRNTKNEITAKLLKILEKTPIEDQISFFEDDLEDFIGDNFIADDSIDSITDDDMEE